jgi:hypothetical protein
MHRSRVDSDLARLPLVEIRARHLPAVVWRHHRACCAHARHASARDVAAYDRRRTSRDPHRRYAGACDRQHPNRTRAWHDDDHPHDPDRLVAVKSDKLCGAVVASEVAVSVVEGIVAAMMIAVDCSPPHYKSVAAMRASLSSLAASAIRSRGRSQARTVRLEEASAARACGAASTRARSEQAVEEGQLWRTERCLKRMRRQWQQQRRRRLQG